MRKLLKNSWDKNTEALSQWLFS